MTYGSQFSPDSARENQQDQRLNGILDYDNRNDWNQGQAALDYGSGTGIEFSVDGANFLINGSKVGAPSNSVQISDGHDTLWRTDHIYASEDGAYNVLEGEPDDNLYAYPEIDASAGTVSWNIGENTQAGGPAPKGQEFNRKRGELIFSILVPPGASDIAQFGSAYVLDRRRPAIDLLNTGRPRTPSISSDVFELEEGDWHLWQLTAWADHTIRVWDYALSQLRYGYFGSGSLHVYIVDWSKLDEGGGDGQLDWNGGDVDWGELAVWESSDTRQRPDNDEEPIVNIDLPTTGVEPFAFVVENTSNNYRFVNDEALSLSVSYTIEDTRDL